MKLEILTHSTRQVMNRRCSNEQKAGKRGPGIMITNFLSRKEASTTGVVIPGCLANVHVRHRQPTHPLDTKNALTLID